MGVVRAIDEQGNEAAVVLWVRGGDSARRLVSDGIPALATSQ